MDYMSNTFGLGPFVLNLNALHDGELADLAAAVRAEQATRTTSAPLDLAEQCLVRCGQHIQAIKAYRTRTNAGLKDAKDACDAFRLTVPGYSQGKTFDPGTGMWVDRKYPHSLVGNW